MFNRNTTFGALLFSAFCSFPAAAAPVLWSGNGHYYDFVASAPTWVAANTAANGSAYLGVPGHLVTFSSQAESDFVITTFPISTSSRYFIGLHLQPGGSLTNPADYLWVDGTSTPYSNWAPSEPDGTFPDAVAVTLMFSANLEWQWDNIADSFGPFPYVVEYDTSAVPEPGGLGLTLTGLGILGYLARRR